MNEEGGWGGGRGEMLGVQDSSEEGEGSGVLKVRSQYMEQVRGREGAGAGGQVGVCKGKGRGVEQGRDNRVCSRSCATGGKTAAGEEQQGGKAGDAGDAFAGESPAFEVSGAQ